MKNENLVTIIASVCLALVVCDLVMRWNISQRVEENSRRIFALADDVQKFLLPPVGEKNPIGFQLQSS